MRSEETKLIWPGLTQGSTYHHIDFYQRVGDNIIHGNFTDENPSAIREQYNQQQYLPMESFLNDTSRNVIDPSFSQYDHNAPYHGYQQPYQPLQPPQPASSWESRYSLGLSASNPEIAPSVIPTTPDAYFVQPHLWNDTVSNTRHTSDYGSGFHDGAYGSYGGSFYTPNPSTPANRQVLQVPTPSPKPSGSAYFYCPKPHCNKEFTNSNHLKKHRSCHEGKMIQCTVCHKRYARKDTILRHLKDIHQMDSVAAKRLADQLDKNINYLE